MFLAVMALYVLVYTPVYGQSAIGEARKLYFFFLIPVLAAMAIKIPEDLRRFLVTIVWAAAGLAIFAFGTTVSCRSYPASYQRARCFNLSVSGVFDVDSPHAQDSSYRPICG